MRLDSAQEAASQAIDARTATCHSANLRGTRRAIFFWLVSKDPSQQPEG